MTILCIPHARDLIRGGDGCTLCALEARLDQKTNTLAEWEKALVSLRVSSEALQARLAEAERLLDDAAEEFQLQHDPEDCIAMRNRILAFLRPTASADASPDLMQHCCPSCGQPSGKGIDLFTYMAELVTKHPTAKGMLDLAMARATAGSASVAPTTHQLGCALFTDAVMPCDCGFDEARATPNVNSAP